MSTTLSPAQTAIRAVLDARRQQPGALLPILHDIQDQLGHGLPEAAQRRMRARVHA
jgi:formate dehydrogenase subunit gamma